MKKPKKPVFGEISRTCRIYLYSGERIEDLLKPHGLAELPKSAEFHLCEDYCGSNECYFEYEIPESEEEFKVRLLIYKQKLAKYENWLKENPDHEQKEQEQKAARAAKAELLKQKRIQHLEEQLKKLKKGV